ncbi:hypothetical protein SAY87_024516 [Trapa incisa]|uniref:BHLH domain-containing protein n=1 Tax=Trapa incisa TaxID=236973 RepID=A0AAN7GK03_9MYRT|nr:hypothetical protein SAY87_024516 [Trapa incisa]
MISLDRMDNYVKLKFFSNILIFLCHCFFCRYLSTLMLRHWGLEAQEEAKMMEPKRSPCSIEHNVLTSLIPKRHKSDLSFSSKDRRAGEKITALQQLVSPFGKTDTASVLLETTEYIQFLHEQIKVLSAPYLQTGPESHVQGLESYSLRRRGLCLVPISCTTGVARTNGADLWAPIKATSPKFEKPISHFN